MDVNIEEIKNGDVLCSPTTETPSIGDISKPKLDGSAKKKRRRGTSKRKIMNPFMKTTWQERRKNDKSKRNNRFRKIVLAKTQAPFNNNQFLMEIHKPEPENNFHILQTPSARTRDSSFSVDSEENYFFSLPEDEEEYLTKEFSSVYEDAQSERLSNMSKDDLVQEYLLLEAKYENLIKRTDRSKAKYVDDDKDSIITEKDMLAVDRENMITASETSVDSGTGGYASANEILQRLKEQDEQIQELKLDNEKLRLENEHLRRKAQNSSEDSESDSSSTSMSTSSCSSRCPSPVAIQEVVQNGNENEIHDNGVTDNSESPYPLVNGFHNPSEQNN